MARYADTEKREEVPAICPLINTCQQHRTDKEEYARLVKKWTAYARSQEPEELEIKRGKKTEKYTLTDVQDVTGTQVFHLEYMPTKEMTPQQKQGRLKAKKEMFQKMCPHFKRDVLGMVTSDPPYHECRIFSEWFYSRKEE